MNNELIKLTEAELEDLVTSWGYPRFRAKQIHEWVHRHHAASFDTCLLYTSAGYKNRQRQKLESIAHSSANRAASQHRKVGLRPMTPYERRIIHIALRDDDRVETVSEGEGPSRHVVVVPL